MGLVHTARQGKLRREYFVKVIDAITNLLIVIIAIGGILIDILQNGKSFNEAAVTYIPLAIGSGILFMLPSFLLSIGVRRLITGDWK